MVLCWRPACLVLLNSDISLVPVRGAAEMMKFYFSRGARPRREPPAGAGRGGPAGQPVRMLMMDAEEMSYLRFLYDLFRKEAQLWILVCF